MDIFHRRCFSSTFMLFTILTWLLGTKSRRKRSWVYFGGAGQNNKEELSAECRGVDCSGDSKFLTELQKIEVIVLDDQKSRGLRRIRTTRSAVYLYDVVNRYPVISPPVISSQPKVTSLHTQSHFAP